MLSVVRQGRRRRREKEEEGSIPPTLPGPPPGKKAPVPPGSGSVFLGRAAAMAPLSLSQLLDVAIGTPEVGAVNFTALYSLLQAMLGHLGLQDLPAQEPGHSLTPLLGVDQPAKAHPGLEKKGDRTEAWAQGTGQQPQEPGERLPGKEPLQGTTSSPQVASVAADVGQMKKKIEANESGISKVEGLPGALGAPPRDLPSSGGPCCSCAALRPQSGLSPGSRRHVGLHHGKGMEFWGGRAEAEMLL